MTTQPPMLIAVAPNGARKTKKDHPALPISPSELAETATRCMEAGAALIHLHVRNSNNRHSIEPSDYEPALKAVSDAVGDQMIVQITSEAAGIYDRHQQMQAIRALEPRAVSVAIRELVPDESAYREAAGFYSDLQSNETLVQHILYTPEEVHRYYDLQHQGIIPRGRNLILFVLGRYSETLAVPEDLDTYLEANADRSPWMCCAFGANEQKIMQRAASLGGHARVGFENNLSLSDGEEANSNSDLVLSTAKAARAAGREPATAKQAAALWA